MTYRTIQSYKGHALSETGAIVAVISLACVVAMTVLQADMDSLLASIRSGVDNRSSVSMVATVSSSNTSKNNGASLGESLDGIDTNNKLSIYSSDSLPYNDIMTTLETTGANGATELLARNIQQAAQKILAEGSINQQTANDILALASQAFRIAEIEKNAEDAIKSGYNHGPIIIDGVQHDYLESYLSSIGMLYTGNNATWQSMQEEVAIRDAAIQNYFRSDNFYQNGWTPGYEMDSFLKQAYQVFQSNDFNNSPYKQQVMDSVMNIMKIADAAESGLLYAKMQVGGSASYYQENMTAFYQASIPSITVNPDMVASVETKKEANKICNKGQAALVDNDCQ